MTNVWSTTRKQIELWGLAVNKTLTALPGSFSISGFAAGLLNDLRVTASPGSYAITGNSAILTAGSSGSTGQPIGLLLALTYP